MNSKIPVIAIVDVGKTNKKLFLFDEQYQVVYEQSARFTETQDEDGDPCENIHSLRQSLFESLREVVRQQEYSIRAINFSTYGASIAGIGRDGQPVMPLYNYLKPYPATLKEKFYRQYGGQDRIATETASPALGSLNAGLQLYRLKEQQPELFEQLQCLLHLPQYMSYLLTGKCFTDITSLGCHTALWDFKKNDYHQWVYAEQLHRQFGALMPASHTESITLPDETDPIPVGIGLHDSSAALIPYIVSFHEPFILISTGTWCISMNPFNIFPLTTEELHQDCLCYMQYRGKPVKASRIFAGREHEVEVQRIANHFHQDPAKYRNMSWDPAIIKQLQPQQGNPKPAAAAPLQSPAPLGSGFSNRSLSDFENDETAYHQLMLDIVVQQKRSTGLVLQDTPVKRLFVDGGFSKNAIYMNLLAAAFPGLEVFAATMAQASAMGAALAIHDSWNRLPMPGNIIELKYYSCNTPEISGLL
ncbi:MAG: FGGY family carbohydrate kinase [Candidatus Pseudobacter hemicellulosilyticus]|uniref:FGGY family carbohydrate kinase n=1 Tax=Candidatus Pseudobacter hemicellulosilyticus TaxID=3121375 RepID=A0AAJ5WMM4_9BACT|nr:MAG: FGGY family carbohydrate kinase [Pseudobacter sp.]